METQTLYCTECGRMLEFKIKPEKNGKKIIVCDYCGHKHCRVVRDGVVMDDRWDSRSHDDTASKCYGVMKNS